MGPAVAEPGVGEAIEHRGAADVIVALRTPVASAAVTASDRARIAAARRRARAAVDGEGDLVVSSAWGAIPGFAATVTREGLDELLRAPDVLRVDLDRRLYAELAQSVPQIHADRAHSAGITGAGVTVAVVDSGVDTTHPDLAPAVVAEACFTRRVGAAGACPNGLASQVGPGSAADHEGHGTAVADVVAGRGVTGAPGVAPGAAIVGVNVFDGDLTRTSDVLSALDWIVSDRPDVDVVNLSLGSDDLYSGSCEAADANTMAEASIFRALRARGITVVAASGNAASSTSVSTPACQPDVIAVGAVYDADLGAVEGSNCSNPVTGVDMVACFSNASGALDLLAPGGAITTAKSGGGTQEVFGTSFSAPHVAGAAALLLQARPDLQPAQIESVLESTGTPVTDTRIGVAFPRVDVEAALAALPTLAALPRPQYLTAAPASFADGTAESGAGPDIGALTVETTASGVLRITVATPNRAELAAGESVQVFLDADRNPATGSAQGAEVGVATSADGAELFRWTGSWTPVRPVRAVHSAGVLTIQLSLDELGITADFGLLAGSYIGSAGVDRAPDSASWPYPANLLSISKAGAGVGAVTGGGANGVSCGARCAVPLARGAAVTLTATPANGSAFVGWEGACSGAGPCSFPMDAPRAVTARFEPLRRLRVTRAGTGVGSVSSAPGGIACGTTCTSSFVDHTTVTLSARPAGGSLFAGWAGACSGTGTCTVTLTDAAAVSATFRDVQRPTASASSSSGRRGRLARLRYRLADNSGRAAAIVTVDSGGRRLARLVRPRARAGPGAAPWRVPVGAPRRLRFCVQPLDAAGNRGQVACAPLSVS